MENLPIEIVAHIFQAAAYIFRSTDRRTVVNIALTSSFVYNTVAPIMYERVIIPSENKRRAFWALMGDKAVGTRVLKLVRFMCTGSMAIGSSSAIKFLVNLETFHGPICVWSDIAVAQVNRGRVTARDVRVWTINLPTDLSGIDHTSLRNLTRYHSFIPNQAFGSTFLEFVRDTAQWTRRLLELLPSLTHLGLSYVYPKEPDQNEVEEDIRVYEVLLRTVSTCQTPCVRVTALRLTGRAVTRLDAYVNAARRIDEDWAMRRVRFWVDEQVIEDWTVERELLIDDARLERSIWTEAKPLSLYVVAAIAAT